MVAPMTQRAPRSVLEQRASGYRADIQGLRALAVVLVILFHAGLPLPGGFVGVDVFFVISGYVITEMLLREYDRTGRLRLGQFYLRRFRRLAPALALVIVVVSIASVFVLSPAGTIQRAAETGTGATLLAGNLVVALTTGDYFDDPASSNPLLHTWSLAVEEQFYLVFPVLFLVSLLLGTTLRSGRSVAWWSIGALTLVSFFFSLAALFSYTPPIFGGWFLVNFYSPVTRAWEFGVGALLAFAATSWATRVPARGGHIAGFLGLLGVLGSALFISEKMVFPGVVALVPVLSTGLLLVSGWSSSSAVSRGLSAPLIVRVGDLSYSLYLWHWPLIVLATALLPDIPFVPIVAAAISVIPAVLSYYAVENPIRYGATVRGRSLVAVIAVTLVVPLAVTLGVRELANLVDRNLGISTRDQWVGVLEGCHKRPNPDQGQEQYSAEWAEGCVWNFESPGKPIYLIGDSNALHFSDSVVGAGALLDRPVYSLTGCSPVSGLVSNSCEPYEDFIYPWLVAAKPGTVIFSSLDTWSFEAGSLESRDGRVSGEDRLEKIAFYGQYLSTSIETLQAAGHEVVIVQTVPTFLYPPPGWDISQCSTFDFVGGECRRDLPLEVVSSLQDPLRTLITRVAADTGSSVLDVRGEYCVDSVCSTSRDGDLLYKDATHISQQEAERLAPLFAEHLRTTR